MRMQKPSKLFGGALCTLPTSNLKTCLAAKIIGSRHCQAAFSLQVPKSCTDLDSTPLYNLISKTNDKIETNTERWLLIFPVKQKASARRLFSASLLEQWPQVCRVKITLELLRGIWCVSTKTNSMKCFVNWILMYTYVRLDKTQPSLRTMKNESLLLRFPRQTVTSS